MSLHCVHNFQNVPEVNVGEVEILIHVQAQS